ncbi:hypothetical protein BVI434_3110012 [Burkholderia vietnamiensis]|nr:hypothetical protein BVI434_3110012 [Burkholderia vietnamiensis]
MRRRAGGYCIFSTIVAERRGGQRGRQVGSADRAECSWCGRMPTGRALTPCIPAHAVKVLAEAIRYAPRALPRSVQPIPRPIPGTFPFPPSRPFYFILYKISELTRMHSSMADSRAKREAPFRHRREREAAGHGPDRAKPHDPARTRTAQVASNGSSPI